MPKVLSVRESVDYLVGLGFKASCVGDNYAYLSGTKVCIRILSDRIQFGAKKVFDRWANSVDFEVHSFPRNEEALESLVQLVEHYVDDGDYNAGWGHAREVTYREAKGLALS